MMRPADAMPAGAELDRLVAEKVMGWHFHSPGHYAMAADGDVPQWLTADNRHAAEVDWSPSTNIAHAWEVKGRLGDLGHHAAIAAPYVRIEDRERENPTQWLAIADRHYTKRGVIAGVIAYAETAPLAICLAALKAING